MAEDDISTKQKNKKNRSASYPALTLEKAIRGTEQIKSNLGLGPFNRQSAAQALGYSGMSGASSTAVAALVHYGLLARRGDVYEVSTLAEDVLTYRDEGERTAAIRQAAQQPKLFKSLLEKFGGRGLPAMLDHILVRDHGINPRVAQEVKKIFIDTMSSAGLLENGVLRSMDDEVEIAPTTAASAPQEPSLVPRTSTTPLPSTPSAHLPLQSIEISKGFSLSYPGSLPLQLVTDPQFTKALQDLKAAIESNGKATKNSELLEDVE